MYLQYYNGQLGKNIDIPLEENLQQLGLFIFLGLFL